MHNIKLIVLHNNKIVMQGTGKTLLVCTGYFLATWLAELDLALLLANYILL